MVRVVGIDPGATGAIALVDTVTKETQVWDFPKLEKDIDCLGVVEICKELKDIDLCIVENVHAMPMQSTVSGFRFGIAVGIARIIPAIISCRVEYISPQRWKKFFAVNGATGTPKSVLKEKAVLKARQLFPQQQKILLKSKDGRSEALLLAEYGVRNHV